MTGPKIFFDSNILVYLAGNDIEKKSKVISILSSDCVISTQVVSENINACLKKLKMAKSEAYSFGEHLLSLFTVATIQPATIKKAMQVSEHHKFSYWDSLIIATALENDCSLLYTEDLQHKQVIESQLTIVNPFL